MIVDYDGLTTIEETPIHTITLGTLSIFDPEDRLFRDFRIGGSSVAGAFDIRREETEYGPVWTLIVKDPNLFDYETAPNHQMWVTVVGENRDGSSASATITFNLTNVNDPENDAPEDILLSNASIDENSYWAVIGDLSVVDVDSTGMYGNDSWEFSIIDDPSNKFELWSVLGPTHLRLKAGATLNFEEAEFYDVKIRVTDSGGLYVDKDFRVHVNNIENEVNYAPTNLSLSGSTLAVIPEIGGTRLIGTLSAWDRNGGDTLTYSIVNDHDNKFVIDGGILWARPTATFDFETKGLHYVTVCATDSGGESVDNTFSIYVQDVNERPNNILLSSNTIAEGSPGGTVIGDLSASDPDGGAQTFTYQIISDPDGKFVIQDNQLKLRPGASLNHEPEPSHAVTIQVTDQGGLSYSKIFEIDVTDVPEAPTDIGLSANWVYENSEGGTRVAFLSAQDEDSSQFSYSLVFDQDSKFQIVGNELQVRPGAILNYESAQKRHTVIVRVEDESHNWFDRQFWIEVADANDAPHNIGLGPGFIMEGPGNRKVGNLSTTDYDAGAGDTNHTYTILADLDSKFEVRGKELWLREGAAIDYETKRAHIVTIRTTDRGGATYDKTFTVVVSDVNEAPNSLTLSNDSVPETLGGLGEIGILQGSDPDGAYQTGRLKYEILNDPDQKFYIATGTNVLRLRQGAILDHEVPSHQVTVRITDIGVPALSFERTFTIHVPEQQERAPTDITFSGNTTLPEDLAAGSPIGTLAGIDPDPGSTFTYAIASDTSGKFEIPLNSNVLKLKDGVTLDYETGETIYVAVRVTDETLKSYVKTFTLTVTNVNERPYDIELSGIREVDENNTAEIVVGELQASDPDRTDTSFTYSIVGNQPQFRISGKQLIALPGLNHEGASYYDITIRARDTGGLTFDEIFRITVADRNDAPDGLTLSGAHEVEENSAGGTLIGYLEGSDQDGDALTYSLYDDPDRKFEVVGNQLRVREGAGLNHETKQSHDVTIVVNDGNKTYFKTFAIAVTNVPDPEPNHAPTNLYLSRDFIREHSDGGTPIGLLSGMDQDGGDVLTYSIVEDEDGKFALTTVSGSLLVLRDGAVIDHDTKTSHDVTIRVTDRHGASLEKTFTIQVIDVDEGPNGGPINLTLSNQSIDENSGYGEIVGVVSATDPDGHRVYYSLVADEDEKFMIVGNVLMVRQGAVLDHESDGFHDVTIRAYDRFGAYVEQGFEITVNNLPEPNRAPYDLQLSSESVDENSEWGTLVGTITGLDLDAGDVLTYSIVEDPSNPFGSFEIVDGNRLVVKWGALLNHEIGPSEQVTIRVTDQDGATFNKEFTIAIDNVFDETNDAPINLTLSNGSVQDGTTGGDGGTLIGILSATDPNGDRLAYMLGTHEKFDVVGNELRLKEGQTVNYTEAQSYELWGYAYDRFGAIVEQQFIITVMPNQEPNHAPTDVALTNTAVREGEARDYVVGRLTANDLDRDTLTFTLIDDAGGRFVLGEEDGHTVLRVANGVKIDYEQQKTLSITVRADDGREGITDQVIQIDVRNVLTESVVGTQDADRIQGGIAYDEFWGMGGNDTLIGGAGNDTLSGGEGEDTFVFHRFGTGNSDLIKDFDVAQDKIVLVQSNAATALSVGVLSSEAFCYGTQAADADDRIIYDQATGRLLYDSDGSGGRAAFEIAIFENRAVLDHTHFVVSQFMI